MRLKRSPDKTEVPGTNLVLLSGHLSSMENFRGRALYVSS